MNTQSNSVGDALENIWSTYNSVSVDQQRVLISHINQSIYSVLNFKDPKFRENYNKGRNKKKHIKGIKRNFSQFEILNSEYKRYKCIKCKEGYHTINNCPKKYIFVYFN